jgi:hypothetical protein
MNFHLLSRGCFGFFLFIIPMDKLFTISLVLKFLEDLQTPFFRFTIKSQVANIYHKCIVSSIINHQSYIKERQLASLLASYKRFEIESAITWFGRFISSGRVSPIVLLCGGKDYTCFLIQSLTVKPS